MHNAIEQHILHTFQRVNFDKFINFYRIELTFKVHPQGYL